MRAFATLTASILAGLVFGIGLAISGMTNPSKVLNFLDFAAIPTGGWDPTLGVVFGTVLAIMFLAYAIQRRTRQPLLEREYHLPTCNRIDAPLLSGAVLFGIGWGLVGLCPGPAIAAVPLAGHGTASLAVFLAALLAGVVLAMVVKARPWADAQPA